MSLRHDRLELLDRYLRIATISRQVTSEMIDAVRGLWRGLGLELTVLASPDGAGTPALYGELPGPEGAPTLLLYGHYDVQPTGDPARWQWQGVKCEPFVPAYFVDGRTVEPRSLDDRALEDVVMVGRGGADNKGQHLSNILGAMDAMRAGTVQWKVKIILDGEEEHGSPNLAAIALAHRDPPRRERPDRLGRPQAAQRPDSGDGRTRSAHGRHRGRQRTGHVGPLRQLRQHRAEPGPAARPPRGRHRGAHPRLRGGARRVPARGERGLREVGGQGGLDAFPSPHRQRQPLHDGRRLTHAAAHDHPALGPRAPGL
jgi:hypothetical protein